MTIVYVLTFIAAIGNSSSQTTAEYYGEQACNEAKARLEKTFSETRYVYWAKGVCTQKGNVQ